ncbi:MAG: type II toxin-antitoxin system HicA family toxin [Lachnospiraceae bacterium]|nr:type II toxin-antitoxin system HicA family toxin [Lachnospiraceae bacterium]
MPSKDSLLKKLMAKPLPTNYTVRELDSLMKKCGCRKYAGGRGSAVKYVHMESGRIVEFDAPHLGNELYRYHVNAVKKFLSDIGEVEE